jgi:hypothetical protein
MIRAVSQTYLMITCSITDLSDCACSITDLPGGACSITDMPDDNV